MKRNSKKIFTSFILAILLNICNITPVFASEVHPIQLTNVTAVKTLPAGEHFTILNTLTFKDTYTLASDYYVQGRWLNLTFGCSVADSDQGIGGIFITVKILDAATGSVLASQTEAIPQKGIIGYPDMTFDLGSFGRTIKIFFDASSYGESNGHYRSATITNLRSYVFGD